MIKFDLNGEDMSAENLNILISRDKVTGEEEVRLYNGTEEIIMTNLHDNIDVSINVSSGTDIKDIYENTKTVSSCLDIITSALETIQNELQTAQKKHEDLYKDYMALCDVLMRKNDEETETIRRIILQDPQTFKGISAKTVGLPYMVGRLIDLYQKKLREAQAE